VSADKSVDALSAAVRAFAQEREWGTYHDPKNLVMALAAEVGELAALLRWVPNSESDRFAAVPSSRQQLANEIGDVGIVLFSLCDRLGIDLRQAIEDKLRLNAANYPADIARGHAERPEAPNCELATPESAVDAASDFGVDIDQLRASLKLTPEERIARLDENAEFVRELRRVNPTTGCRRS
jgi:dCTP diphosphatase